MAESAWRRTLQSWLAHTAAAHDRGKLQLRRWSPLRHRLTIEPYRGHGTPRLLHCGGRVLEHVDFSVPDAHASAWRNVNEFIKRMRSDEVPFARVRARFHGIEQVATADREGHVRFELALPDPLESSGWHDVTLELVDPPPRRGQVVRATAHVLVPPPSARLGVISDIDDTVLWTNVGNKLKMLSLLLRSNPHTRKPFKGVAAFYQALRDGASGAGGNPVFYVSSSPWNLYAPLAEFLDLQGIPAGPLMLRDFGPTGTERRRHKHACIERILATHAQLPFVLIGDSGERDPEIYRQVVHDHPNRVRVIYIRSVNPDPARIEAIDRLIDEVRPTGVQLVLAPDSEFAAAHAAAEGLISAAGLAAVRAHKRHEQPALAVPA